MKSTAMAYEDDNQLFHAPKKRVQAMNSKVLPIDQLHTEAILWHLFVRHWKFLAFSASLLLNVLYVVKHFGLIR